MTGRPFKGTRKELAERRRAQRERRKAIERGEIQPKPKRTSPCWFFRGRLLTVESGGESKTHLVKKARKEARKELLKIVSGDNVVLHIPLGVADLLAKNGQYVFPCGVSYRLSGRKALKGGQLELLEKAAAYLQRNALDTKWGGNDKVKRERISQALVEQDARRLVSLLQAQVEAIERMMRQIREAIIDKEGEE